MKNKTVFNPGLKARFSTLNFEAGLTLNYCTCLIFALDPIQDSFELTWTTCISPNQIQHLYFKTLANNVQRLC
jgi:hypothetical protein